MIFKSGGICLYFFAVLFSVSPPFPKIHEYINLKSNKQGVRLAR